MPRAWAGPCCGLWAPAPAGPFDESVTSFWARVPTSTDTIEAGARELATLARREGYADRVVPSLA
jgi:hypothetical protein